MKRKSRKIFVGMGLLIAFALWTVLVCYVDVRAAGPQGSRVGFATLNRAFHSLTGTNMQLYEVTDWLGLVPIAVAFGFAVLGLLQLIKRKSLLKVDLDIILLGAFYLVVIGVYILFELVVVNYRPVLIEGYLEASYPSSTTVLVMCVIPTGVRVLNARIRSKTAKRAVIAVAYAFVLFMVVGRLLSGVHWLSDIIGGALFSAGIDTLYFYLGTIFVPFLFYS